MSKILSIEMGTLLTRVSEIDYRTKSPKLYKSVTVSSPEGLVEDGFVGDNAAFASTIKAALSMNKMKSKQVIFSVSSSKIVTREAILPIMKPNQLDAMIRTNITDYLPIDLNNFELAHMVIGTQKDDEGVLRNRVLIMAADKTLIDSYAAFADALGLKMEGIDYSGNSVFQIMKNECKEETEMVIKVEEKSTTCTIISGKELVMQRNIAYGMENAVYEVIENQVFSARTYDQALNILKGKTCLRSTISEATRVIESNEVESDDEALLHAKGEVTASLAGLVSNVARVIDLYNSRNADHPVKKVELIGLGSDISGLSKLMTNELGVKTSVVNNVTGVNFGHAAIEGATGRYIAVAGAAIAPVGFMAEEKKAAELGKVNYTNLSILCAVLFILVCGVMAYFSLIPYVDEQTRETYLKSQEAIYQPYEKTYKEYTGTEALYAEIRNAYHSTKNPNDNVLRLLYEMENRLPQNALLEEFHSDDQTVVITMAVPSIEEAGEVIEVFREFEALDTVHVDEINNEVLSPEDWYDRETRILKAYYNRMIEEGGENQETIEAAEAYYELQDFVNQLISAVMQLQIELSEYSGDVLFYYNSPDSDEEKAALTEESMADRLFGQRLDNEPDAEGNEVRLGKEPINIASRFTITCTYKPLNNDQYAEEAE